MNRLGRGWAPEKVSEELSSFAIRELRILIQKIFTQRQNRKKDFSRHDYTRSEL